MPRAFSLVPQAQLYQFCYLFQYVCNYNLELYLFEEGIKFLYRCFLHLECACSRCCLIQVNCNVHPSSLFTNFIFSFLAIQFMVLLVVAGVLSLAVTGMGFSYRDQASI